MLLQSVPLLKRSHRMRRFPSFFPLCSSIPPPRWTSSSSSSSSSSSYTRSESIRAALRTLSLPGDATDADIKTRFQDLAKRHHPDVSPDTIGRGESDKMHQSIEAYRLLRQHSEAERRLILRAGHTQEEADARAERIYRGRPHGGPRAAGHTGRTAQFNQSRERMRAESPPWRADGENGSSAQQSPRQRQRRHSLFALFGPGGGSAQAAMDRVFSEYQHNSGFAGMDGSRYDDPKNTARAGWVPLREMGPNGMFGASPVFGAGAAEMERRRAGAQQDYLWRRQRAEERAVVDEAVGQRLLVGIVLFLTLCFLSMMFVTVWRRGLAQKNYNALSHSRREDE